MAQADQPEDHLSDYERAVCYYTLPRVLHPLTLGLIVAYAVCLLEAVIAVAVGVLWDIRVVMVTGLYALAGIVIFGLIVFFLRALKDDVRKRRLLQEAQGIPDARQVDPDLPDPFAEHLLLKRPAHTTSALYACTEDNATIQYFVEANHGASQWRIKTSQDEEVCRAEVLRGPGSFVYGKDLPRAVSVHVGDREVAQIVRRFSLESAIAVIEPKDESIPRATVRQNGIHMADRLVGRIYHLRGSYYLDVEKLAFNEVILAYFVTVS